MSTSEGCTAKPCDDLTHSSHHGAQRAEILMVAYGKDARDDQEILTDMLTDLMHWAAERDPEMFDEALASAERTHFPAEQAGVL